MVTGGTEYDLLRIIPLAPLLAAAVHAVLLVLVRRPVAQWLTVGLSCGSVTVSFAVSCFAFGRLVQLPTETRLLVDNLYTWIGAGVGNHAFSTEFAFQLDALSSVMAIVVSGVGMLIHFYSVGYMEDDEREDRGFQRYFCYLNLFMFSMLTLVLADNLVMMFLGWEGVGLCSYLLIGFWYADQQNAFAGSKAFVVNRIGDFAFLIGLLLLFSMLAEAGHPTLGFQDIERYFAQIADATIRVPEWLPRGPEWRLVNVVAVCLFFGACGKSAQIPLYVWLPSAMAGPTPVSALIHAATMVGAGVYMACRMSFLFAAAPEASHLIAWTGALTAVLGASFAIAQTDIKKVLAYSTMSQLGFMFVAVGCGAFSVAMFHLATQAVIKALLFLAAGSVILATDHEQDMGSLGGLRRHLPRTRWTFLVGTLAIAGVPPLAGFFSKDQILTSAYASQLPGHDWLYWLLSVTAGFTSFYMFRLYFRIFRGKSRVSRRRREHMEDPSESIIAPLYILAFFAVVGGLAGLPQSWGDLSWIELESSNSFANFLGPVLASSTASPVEDATEYRLAGRAVSMAMAGMVTAWLFYVRWPAWPRKISRKFNRLNRALAAGFWVDEIYDTLLVRPLVAISDRVLFRGIDKGLIDGLLVNGTARGVRALAESGLRRIQSGHVQAYLFAMVAGAVAIAAYLMR